MWSAIIRGSTTDSWRRREQRVVKRVPWCGENASGDCSATIIARRRNATQYFNLTASVAATRNTGYIKSLQYLISCDYHHNIILACYQRISRIYSPKILEEYYDSHIGAGQGWRREIYCGNSYRHLFSNTRPNITY